MKFIAFFRRAWQCVQRVRATIRAMHVLFVLREGYASNPNGMPAFIDIRVGLSLSGRGMNEAGLVAALSALVTMGCVQRIDGGNKEKRPQDCWYVLTEDGRTWSTAYGLVLPEKTDDMEASNGTRISL